MEVRTFRPALTVNPAFEKEPGSMATASNTTPPRALPDAPVDEVRTLVEIDHRRASIAVHVASDITRAARTATSLWLPPEKAEALARELLSAVEA